MPERPANPDAFTWDMLRHFVPDTWNIKAIPVYDVGMNATLQAGNKLGGIMTFAVDANVARRVLAEDKRRSRVTLWCGTQVAIIAATSADAQANNTACVPLIPNVPIDLNITSELYAMSASGSVSATVYAIVEQMSD